MKKTKVEINHKKIEEIAKILELRKDFFLHLLPDEIANVLEDTIYIAGGSIYCLYNDKEVKDYDFFSTDKEAMGILREWVLQNVTMKYTKGVKVGDLEDMTVVVTDNAISIGDYQMITRWVGEPEEVINQFDFKHNMFYYKDDKINNIVSWDYIGTTELFYNEERARDICGTIMRTAKFCSRGFTISNREMSKVLLKLNDVGFNERELEILRQAEERNNFGS